MKIYFAVDNLYQQTNPYTWTLAKAFNEIDASTQMVWGLKKFWADDIYSCDIIHIHWPEQLLLHHGEHSAHELNERLFDLKEKGIKIVATCHNLQPHKNASKDRFYSYEVVYNCADVIFHLGEYSLDLLKDKYVQANHVLIQHHVYDTVYTAIPSKQDALEMLNLDKNKKYVLCFGQFRNNDEREMVIKLSKALRLDGYNILAPGFSPVAHKRRNIKILLETRIKYLYYTIKYPNIIKCYDKIPDSLVPAYYAASDICFIQRRKILNSGNLPLALYMGNIVVGPNMGNVGPLLKQTGNPTFETNIKEDYIKAVKEAFNKPTVLGGKNREWAFKFMLTKKIATEIYNVYFQLRYGKQ